MKSKTLLTCLPVISVFLASLFFFVPNNGQCSVLKVEDEISLPEPAMNKWFSLEKALKQRKSTKSYDKERSVKNLSLYTPGKDLLPNLRGRKAISRILWAAAGVNRKAEGKRTHPSAMAKYSVKVYLCNDSAVWEYIPLTHSLKRIGTSFAKGISLMNDCPSGKYVRDAGFMLVFVGDVSNLPERFAPEMRWNWINCEAGTMIENVHLQCAALGLGTAVNAGFDSPLLVKFLALKETQKPLFILPVGYATEQD